MSYVLSLSRVVVFFVVLCATFLLAVPGNCESGSGFFALSGGGADAFVLPGDVQLISSRTLPSGLVVERYQQFHGQAEVLGGQITVYREEDGSLRAVIGAHYPDIVPVNAVRLAATRARAAAEARIGGDGEWTVQLMIDPAIDRYFYRVENRRFDSRWFHWIDADNGSLLNAYDGLTKGSGIGVLGDVKDLTGLTTEKQWRTFTFYRLQDPAGRYTTYDGKNRFVFFLPGRIGLDLDDNWELAGRTSPGQPALVDAHFYAQVADLYFINIHGFNWTDFYPQGLVSTVHYQRNYVNAYWNGQQLVYGDGDGINYLELCADLDIVAHEISHGVTSATSDLIYQYESGALNESFSDIFGTAAEFYYGTGNWTIGEDIMPFDNGLRNMANPLEDGDPSHYDDRYTGDQDNGGVHTNSGISNHWFYLLVEGGQNANPLRATGTDVVGIGMAAAEEAAFLGFTGLPQNAGFCEARGGTIAVANPDDVDNIADAWDEVGVDSALCQ